GNESSAQLVHEPIGPECRAPHCDIADRLASAACNSKAILPLAAERQTPGKFLGIALHMDMCANSSHCSDAIESCAKPCWAIASSDRVLPDLASGGAPGKCDAWKRTHQQGGYIGTDPAEPLEVRDRSLGNHEGVKKPTRRTELLHHALADSFAEMGW